MKFMLSLHELTVNYSTLQERQDAEQMYLKRILQEMDCLHDSEVIQNVDSSTTSNSKVLAAHPRFHQLSLLYPDIQVYLV